MKARRIITVFVLFATLGTQFVATSSSHSYEKIKITTNSMVIKEVLGSHSNILIKTSDETDRVLLKNISEQEGKPAIASTFDSMVDYSILKKFPVINYVGSVQLVDLQNQESGQLLKYADGSNSEIFALRMQDGIINDVYDLREIDKNYDSFLVNPDGDLLIKKSDKVFDLNGNQIFMDDLNASMGSNKQGYASEENWDRLMSIESVKKNVNALDYRIKNYDNIYDTRTSLKEVTIKDHLFPIEQGGLKGAGIGNCSLAALTYQVYYYANVRGKTISLPHEYDGGYTHYPRKFEDRQEAYDHVLKYLWVANYDEIAGMKAWDYEKIFRKVMSVQGETKIKNDVTWPGLEDFKRAINDNRPASIGVTGHGKYGEHYMTAIGYVEGRYKTKTLWWTNNKVKNYYKIDDNHGAIVYLKVSDWRLTHHQIYARGWDNSHDFDYQYDGSL